MNKKRKTTKSAKAVQQPKTPAKRTARSALSAAASAQKSVKERVAALAEASPAVCQDDKHLQTVLNILRSKDEPLEVRLAALKTLQTASFSVIAFEACRGDYIAALREIAKDPASNQELRQRVLGILAREKDGFAQKKLLEGLQNPDKALVPPEKALQLLSYDVHADAYTLARKIINEPPNPTAKREALRLLAADATSAPVFEKILRDKDEMRELRQISAAALQAIDPGKLQEHARAIVLDTSEYDDIQATSLTALTHFAKAADMANDEALQQRVASLNSEEAAPKIKQSARQFLSKYSR